MSTEEVPLASITESAENKTDHPLCPITASEIQQTARLIKGSWPSKTDIHFKGITLEEPAKAQLVPYLEAEHRHNKLPSIDRRAFVSYYIRNTVSGDLSSIYRGARKTC